VSHEFVRSLDKGMGEAVFRRTYARPNETWAAVAKRVAEGNCAILPSGEADREAMERHLQRGSMLMSGRHLQHGDADQPDKPQELMTNCSSAATSFTKFYLLMNGSGVGRAYDDALCLTDWGWAPTVQLGLSLGHPDFERVKNMMIAESTRDPEDVYGSLTTAAQIVSNLTSVHQIVSQREFKLTGRSPRIGDDTLFKHSEGTATYVRVPDTREGWAQALEIYEAMAYGCKQGHTLYLDFSAVRSYGTPIGGMQDRPASGPESPMRAFVRVSRCDFGPEKWLQALAVDHFFSEEVQVGGARRAARMATKYWKDPGAAKFVTVKTEGGFWTANHSLTVDKEFWDEVDRDSNSVAGKLLKLVTSTAYNSGEPGLINHDRLDQAVGRPTLGAEEFFAGMDNYAPTAGKRLLKETIEAARTAPVKYITNPCGEISLSTLGGYCVIADVAPVAALPKTFAELAKGVTDEEEEAWDSSFIEACELSARALVRVNQQRSFYRAEVLRTQRIGVSLTGIHEYAWLRFGLTFDELLDDRSKEFWAMIQRASEACKNAANAYADALGVARPATVTTIKPSGTVSKLFGLTEGAHLPAYAFGVRWVQYQDNDPRLATLKEQGHPSKKYAQNPSVTLIGFPTVPLISRLGMPYVISATEASPEEQYEYLRRLEKYWIGEEQGNQISYTLKLSTASVTEEDFHRIVLTQQRTVKCCAIMPTRPDKELEAIYGYLPEEACSLERLEEVVKGIDNPSAVEDIDLEHLKCASGACPI
jgi:hypothetical protein